MSSVGSVVVVRCRGCGRPIDPSAPAIQVVRDVVVSTSLEATPLSGGASWHRDCYPSAGVRPLEMRAASA